MGGKSNNIYQSLKCVHPSTKQSYLVRNYLKEIIDQVHQDTDRRYL